MANQDSLTIGGIGKDPSGSYSQYDSKWRVTGVNGSLKYSSIAGKTLICPDTTGSAGFLYSEPIALKGSILQGAKLSCVDSGNAKVMTTWQWYNPTGEGYDDNGVKVDGTWTSFATATQAPSEVRLDAEAGLTNAALLDAVMVRVKCEHATTTSDESATINATDALLAYVHFDEEATKNDTSGVVVSADPS